MISVNQIIKYKPIYDPNCNCINNHLTKSQIFKILGINETYATIIRVGAEYEGEQHVPLDKLDEKYQRI